VKQKKTFVFISESRRKVQGGIKIQVHSSLRSCCSEKHFVIGADG